MSPPGDGPRDGDADRGDDPPTDGTLPHSEKTPPHPEKSSGDPGTGGASGDDDGTAGGGEGGGIPRPEADHVDPGGDHRGLIQWFLHSDDLGVTFAREFLGSALVVLVIGLLLFAISGVWPPMVAVKSGSMEPHMSRGDLVFVMDEGRLSPQAAVAGTGVATYRSGRETGYRRFGDYGDVIIYRKNGETEGTPIIHRARFWVEKGENWYDEADPQFRGSWDGCDEMPHCPAKRAGFITKGDANGRYDQVTNISAPVRPEWIKGTAEVRIPLLGYVRLQFSTL